ncbi:unnamed protein product [Cylicocyclus nassatus]|uniref:Uncharacterized protein n=1 Tax=Cylicocyclus nassatus TaxID=53992 RepID=A0AA36GSA3_CYLNA|nr:unnamed protein product [Cylicocyclus nassatus]
MVIYSTTGEVIITYSDLLFQNVACGDSYYFWVYDSANRTFIAVYQAHTAMVKTGEFLSEVPVFMTNATNQLQTELADVFIFMDYARRVGDMLGYTHILPLALVCFSIFGLAIIASWTFLFYNKRYHYNAICVRGVMFTAATSVGYLAMVVGSLICIMAAACFLLAFVAMSLCAGLFMDSDLRLFQALSNIEFIIPVGSQKVRHTYYDIFYKCKNGYTFFESLNGALIMAEDEFREASFTNFLE